MSYSIDLNIASSHQIEKEVCLRIEKIRLSSNISQAQLATEAGISLRTMGRLEKGQGISLDTFIRVLMALGVQQNLDNLLPNPEIRPIERIKINGQERKRARPKPLQNINQPWAWGDDSDHRHGWTLIL